MSIFNSMHADIFSWPICFIQIHVLIHNNLNTVISSFVSWEIVQNIICLLALHWQNCSNCDLFIVGILYTNKTYFIILLSFTNQLFKIKSHKKHHSDPRNLTSSHEIHNYYFTPHSQCPNPTPIHKTQSKFLIQKLTTLKKVTHSKGCKKQYAFSHLYQNMNKRMIKRMKDMQEE